MVDHLGQEESRNPPASPEMRTLSRAETRLPMAACPVTFLLDRNGR